MTHPTMLERPARRRPPLPEAPAPAPAPARATAIVRTLGALTLLAVGAVHLDQYFAVHFRVVPVIGPLFALNFTGATAMGVLLLVLPFERMPGLRRAAGALLALGGIALAAIAFVFLFVSEHRPLFGFMDYGYRPAILAALAAEAATAALLGSWLVLLVRRR